MIKLVVILSLLSCLVGCDGKYDDLRNYYFSNCSESKTVKFNDIKFESTCNGRNIFATLITGPSEISKFVHDIIKDYITAGKTIDPNFIDNMTSLTIFDLLLKNNFGQAANEIINNGYVINKLIEGETILHRLSQYKKLREWHYENIIKKHEHLIEVKNHQNRNAFGNAISNQNYIYAWKIHAIKSQKNYILANAHELPGNFLFNGELNQYRELIKELGPIFDQEFNFHGINGFKFIHFAIIENNKWLFEYLEENHVDMYPETSIGNLNDVAAYFGASSMIAFLKDKGYKITENTLKYAIQNCQKKTVEDLIESGEMLYSYDKIFEIKGNRESFPAGNEAEIYNRLLRDKPRFDRRDYARCGIYNTEMENNLYFLTRTDLPIEYIRAITRYNDEKKHPGYFGGDWLQTNYLKQQFLSQLLLHREKAGMKYHKIYALFDQKEERTKYALTQIDTFGMNNLHYWLIGLSQETQEDLDFFDALIIKGSDLNIKNKRNETILHLMARNGLYQMAKKILSRSFNDIYKFKRKNFRIRNSHGQKASDVAKEHGHYDLAKLLKRKGA